MEKKRIIDAATEGLYVRVIPGPNKDMELLYDHRLMAMIIPKGFVFDGASCIDEDNNVRMAALLHDYYYRTTTHNFTREMVDELFYSAMIELGVPELTAKTIYAGVRIGGGEIWAKQQKNNIYIARRKEDGFED